MVSGYTQQEVEKMMAENESLRSQLAAKDEVVSKLEDTNCKLNGTISKL